MERNTEFNQIISTLIEPKIQAGFHSILQKSPQEYIADFEKAIETSLVRPVPHGTLVLVETRIPAEEQLKRLGIDLDPSVFRIPKASQDIPYSVWITLQKNRLAVSPAEQIKSLPDNLKPASVFEGINSDFKELFKKSYSFSLGGELLEKPTTLCLETYLGTPRLTHMRFKDKDPLVDLLAVQK